MNLLGHHSLRWKLVLVIMLSVGMALLLATGAFLTLEVRSYRASAKRELGLLAEVLSEGSAAAFEVKDQRRADQLLATLASQKRIVEAVVVDRSGHLFASFRQAGAAATFELPKLPAESFAVMGDSMVLAQSIWRGGEPIGTIYLRSDLQELNTRIYWTLAIGCLATLLIGLATFAFAMRMGRVVTQPILRLADAARRIATGQSIGECVIRETQDEVGILVDSFNQMLGELGERQTRLEESQRLAHLGNWTYDPETTRFDWSGETFHIFGLEPGVDRPSYQAFRNLIRRADIRLLERAILATRRNHEQVFGDFRLTRQDGFVHWVHVTSAWFKDDDGRDFLRGTVMDISDRKQSEAALLQGQKLESLGVLAGGIAHDFNNLLGALRGNLDLARTNLPAGSPVTTHLSKSDKIIEKAANLTRQLLAYSGKGQFQVVPLDLSQQVKEMGPLLSVSVSKKAELRYQVADGLPAIIGDTSQIQQVIMNLVINASEALSDRGGYVLIRTGSEYLDEGDLQDINAGEGLIPGPYVILEVQDNGIGMDAHTLQRIFDPFFTTKFQGRGLGLAAMLGIVKSHQGGIKVHSEPGLGTSFKILFPSSNQFAEKPAPIEPSSEINRSGRILVVDDEPDNRFAASDLFEHLGFEVVLASDGHEGLQKVKEHRGDLRMILLDLTMPRMGGVECLKALRTIDPTVPVLMTSGFSESESTRELADLRWSGFIQKPYSLSSLKTKMKEILG